MLWKGRRESSNIEDRRGQYARGRVAIGGGGLIMALIAIFLFGQDPMVNKRRHIGDWEVDTIIGRTIWFTGNAG